MDGKLLTRITCLWLFLAAVSASAWEGWHPTAWTNYSDSVETVEVYATSHAAVLTNWTSTTSYTAFTERWLANIAFYTNRLAGGEFNTNRVITNTWTFTLNAPTGTYTRTIVTATNQTATNLVIVTRDILALDVTLALQERQEAIRFPRGSGPRFLRDNRAALEESKLTLLTSMVEVIRYPTNASESATVTDRRYSGITGYWVDHQGKTAIGVITTMPVYAQSASRPASALDGPIVSASIEAENLTAEANGSTNSRSFAAQGFPALSITGLAAYAATPTNYLAWTPWRSLNGLGGSEGRCVTTTWVVTWGTNAQTVTDYHGGSHSLTGTNGQFISVISTSAYVQAGWLEKDYGWQGIRRCITNLWLTTSKSYWSDRGGRSVTFAADVASDPFAAFTNAWTTAVVAVGTVWTNGGCVNAYSNSASCYGVPEPKHTRDAYSSFTSSEYYLPMWYTLGVKYTNDFGGSFGDGYGWRAEAWSQWMQFAYEVNSTNIEHVAHLAIGVDSTPITKLDVEDFPQLGVIVSNSAGFGLYASQTNLASTNSVTIGDSSTTMPRWVDEPPSTGEEVRSRGWRVNWAGWLIDWTATTNGLKYR